MGYFVISLNRRPTFHLQDYWRIDFPILSWTIFFYPFATFPGVLIPIPGSSQTSVPSVRSHIVYLNLLHCATTSLTLWVALISPLLLVPDCQNYEQCGAVSLV